MRRYQNPSAPVHSAAHPLVHKLWQLMREHRVSQEDVAERAGVSSSGMRKWRRGDRSPNLMDLEACLNVFGYEIGATEVKDDHERETRKRKTTYAAAWRARSRNQVDADRADR